MKNQNKIRFIQIGCKEVAAPPDYRQARAVLKYRPDIILLEYPQDKRTPDLIFNRYSPTQKPLEELKQITEKIRTIAKTTHPWAISDIAMYGNVAKLWKAGQQIFLYAVDGPHDLTRIGLDNVLWHKHIPLPKAKKHILWWAKMYLREHAMVRHIQWVLKEHDGKDLTILVFIEKFHWTHVLFLLKNPSRKEIWDYYFGFWKDLTPNMLGKILKKENPALYKFWKSQLNIL